MLEFLFGYLLGSSQSRKSESQKINPIKKRIAAKTIKRTYKKDNYWVCEGIAADGEKFELYAIFNHVGKPITSTSWHISEGHVIVKFLVDQETVGTMNLTVDRIMGYR